MVTRVVKMTFRGDTCGEFIAMFNKYKDQIRNANGCQSLTLLRDVEDTNVFFTYSQWVDDKHLDEYRYSAVFAEVWPQTKALFGDSAEAWTTSEIVQL